MPRTAILAAAGLLFVKQALAQSGPYGQCGGVGWAGPTTCQAGWACAISNDYYSQCTPSSPTPTATASSAALTGIAAAAPTTPPSTLTGKLPALGWNSWNAYRGDINESKIMAAAKLFVSLGLKDVGYEYVNIDDCWAQMSRTNGKMVPDPNKFPNGIKGLASSIHALGLKIGIYSDAGTATCAGYPGSLGYEAVDATTFNEWGVDYLKYDNCNVPSNWTDASNPQNGDWYNSNSAIRYRQMTSALATQSRPIQFSLCIWGAANVWDWGAKVGHSWRMSGDSSATWSYIKSIIRTNAIRLDSVKFGAHNDMDMMEIGNGAMTLQEQRTHFAAWIFMKSPILLGTDLSKLNSTQVAIIKNAELLAFHQDATVGTPAKPFTPYASAPAAQTPEYYAGSSSRGMHVFIINTGDSAATKTFTFSSVPGLASGSYKLHDMWTATDLSGTYAYSSNFSVSVAAHDTVAYRLVKA